MSIVLIAEAEIVSEGEGGERTHALLPAPLSLHLQLYLPLSPSALGKETFALLTC